MKRSFILILICVVALNSKLLAQMENGLAALQIGVGARPAGMGEAFTAVADDATSAFWNPAGNAWLEKRQAHFTHTEWFQDVQQNAASIVFPQQKYAIGIHALLCSVVGIEQRISPTEEPLSTFSAHDFVFGISIARKLRQNLAVGCNVRYINERIYIESASGFSIDAGIQYLTPIKGLQTGLSLQHFGATKALKQENIQLPKTVRFGAAYKLPVSLIKINCLVTADYIHVFDQNDAIHIGTEIYPWTLLALRMGYQTGYTTHDISAGFGLKVSAFRLDYAYVPFKQDLGNSHRFSFTANF